ncbi:TetR/AcrR family transcriptional regulator [Mycobacterium palustre]|uniref:TetR/AcrR family transcriptional regulator n=1 Tax=Mycobacterium palustre TaxID=153971 RepID=UPI0035581492
MTDIAAAARVTKGAVYHHFPDKRALFEAVVHRCNEAAQRRVYEAAARHGDDPWRAALAALSATLDVSLDRVVARLLYIEGPVGLGWRRWRESEDHYIRRNVRLLWQGLIDAGVFADDIPVDAMTQLLSGMITHAGILLAEVPNRRRKAVRHDLCTAIHQVMLGLRRGRPPA